MTRRILTHREQYEMLSPWRIAARSLGVSDTNYLKDEFDDWWAGGSEPGHPHAPHNLYTVSSSANPEKPITDWSIIEKFLSSRYPDVVGNYEHPINKAFMVLHNVGHGRNPEAWDWGDPDPQQRRVWQKLYSPTVRTIDDENRAI